MAKEEVIGILASWLKDAHAMEETQIKLLKRAIKDFDDDDRIKRRLERHLEQTQRQREIVEECLNSIGEQPARTKDFMSKMMGAGQGMSASAVGDEKVKHMIILVGAEYFEFACYEAIREAAQYAGEGGIAEAAKQIGDQELDMAEWAEDNLSGVVREQLMSAR
ncbi:MAG: yciE [Candidatus Saccharibacteria bacterium]|nr:yciE [Candidatus Saccharibacteria bacterium]